MTTVPLNQATTVTLNSSGNGTAKLGPLSARESWQPAIAHVSASTAVNEAVCKVYVGSSPIAANFRDGTFSGSSGDASDNVAGLVRVGEWVWGVWTGGDSGAVATLTVTGTKEV